MNRGENNPKFTGYKEISGRYWARIKYRALQKKLEFNLDIKEVWDLYEKQGRKCALSGRDIVISSYRFNETTASLDRKDNNLGYIFSNVQWVHKDFNYLKNDLDQNNLLNMCKDVYLNSLRNERDWHKYLISLASIIATRSKDPSTKCGCVITDSQYRIISCGYNGPIQGIDDSIVPKTRPEKYDYMLHSEENAILFANQSIKGCYIFINGFPCSKCTRMLIQAGITKIFYGNLMPKVCNDKDNQIVRIFCDQKKVELTHINCN